MRTSIEDPGLSVLKILLDLLGADVDARTFQKWSRRGPLDLTKIVGCVREAGLTAHTLKVTWDELADLPLPAIPVIGKDGFLLLGKIKGDEAAVLLPGAARPTLMTRTELETSWDGLLILVQKRPPMSERLGAVGRATLTRVMHSLRNAGEQATQILNELPSKVTTRAHATAQSTAIVLLSDQARKLGRAVTRFNSEARKNSDQLAFLPAALEIVETPPSPIGRATLFTVIGVFAVALLWASFGTVDIVAVAPGKLIPSSRTKTIQPFETGVVRGIYARDGQTVAQGDLLIELDSTMSGAELGRLRSDLMAAQFDVARLKAALGESPDPISAFQLPDATQTALVATHRRLLISQTAERNSKIAAIDRQLTQKEAERTTFSATIDKLGATIKPLQQRVEIREQLFEKQLGSKITYLTELQELVGQQQEMLVQKSKYNEADAAVAALKETKARTIAEHERALLEELSKAEQKASGLAQDVIKAEQRTSLQRLTAPIDGVVQQLEVHTIGGVVTPAQTLMLVVPIENRLEIQAMIPNHHIGFVEVGQDVAIKVDTFSFTRYGLLVGKIASISQDAVIRNKLESRAGGFTPVSDGGEAKAQELSYAARIVIDRTHMDIDGKRFNLSAGMAVTAEIKTGGRTIISYLLSPLSRYKQESLRER